MIHDENDILTDDELVVARGVLENQGMDAFIYIVNILVDLGC